jgi:hypothetical protein
MICIGYIVVTIRDALGIRETPLPHSFIIIYIFGLLGAAFVYDPIRRRLAMYAYKSWLKSFEDEYV